MITSVLRFVTAGSVDDGKSTLIGRLLYDSKALLSDQVTKLDEAAANGEQIDFAGLTDGLAAEREQGITIDVAYRYFATPKRKFIIADAPGHEQYTRNMITGASTAQAAIILIDATRVLNLNSAEPQLLPQTKRHSAILKLLGTPHLIVAVNKLDLLNFNQQTYEQIIAAYRKIAEQLNLKAQLHFIPISALAGDNIVHPSNNTPWYTGDALLPLLEKLPDNRANQSIHQSAHFPVQRVLRQDGSSSDDFRGYQGRLEAGTLKIGDIVKVLPSGKTTQITEIYSPNGKVHQAFSGDVLTIVLGDDLDVSRGDAIIAANSSLQAHKNIQASLCWFDDVPLNPSRSYLLKHTSATVTSKIKQINYVLDVHTLSSSTEASKLGINDIGQVSISLQQPLNATYYAENPALGSFILIDEVSNHTVAVGMINGLSDANHADI